MLKFVFLFLLAVSSVLHLYGSWVEKNKVRSVTKPLLLVFIVLYYVTYGARILPLLVAALVASWLGDVLLIPKGNAWFTAGGIAFMLAHFLFIAVYVPQVDFAKVNWLITVPAAVVYYGVSAVIIHLLTPTTPEKMRAPMYIYLLANSTMNVFALMQLISNPCAGSAVAYTGAALFFVSDCTLFLVRYYKKPDVVFKRHFTVMLTYILGEFMITQGMIMLSK
ncbi:MAG: lysoplasmalogenase [Clostridia bacterium]|nr:lysoplasmalogenase [Clostridia bacterium]